MLDGVMPTWFDDPRSSIVERLVRLGRSIPAGRPARLPLLPRPRAPPPRAPVRRPAARRHRQRPVAQPRPLARLGPPARCRAVASTSPSSRRSASSPLRPETRLYLGLLHPADGLVGAKARLVAAQRFVHDFGVATDCGWSRHRPQEVEPLIELHRATSTPIEPVDPRARRLRLAGRVGADPRRRLDPPTGRRVRRVLRQRRPAQLVPQPRPDRRGARPPARPTARSSSTTRAAPASSSTGSSCACSTPRPAR